jgi:hypothetical protein
MRCLHLSAITAPQLTNRHVTHASLKDDLDQDTPKYRKEFNIFKTQFFRNVEMFVAATDQTFQRFIMQLYVHETQTAREEIKPQLHEPKLLKHDDSKPIIRAG